MSLTTKINKLVETKLDEKKDINIRKDYYAFSDGLIGLNEAILKSKDKELAKLAKQILALDTKLVAHLNKNYKWD